jgi:AcrR family transcriptional regulator
MKMTDGQSFRKRGARGARVDGLPSARDEKRLEKRERLRRASIELFNERGVDETAVDDIVRHAGVAKGTFYLYFKSKEEILSDIVAARSRHILARAMAKVRDRSFPTPREGIVAYIGEVVEILRRNKRTLELIHKNLSWGLYRKLVEESESDDSLAEMKERFWKAFGRSGRDPEKVLFVLIELTSSLCYSSIVLKEPADIESMKPILIDSVRRIVS